MHYGFPALWHLGVIGRHGRVQRSATRRAAARLASHALDRARYRRDARDRGHGGHAVAEAPARPFIRLAECTRAQRRRVAEHGNRRWQRAASVNAVMASSVGHQVNVGYDQVDERPASQQGVALVRLSAHP